MNSKPIFLILGIGAAVSALMFVHTSAACCEAPLAAQPAETSQPAAAEAKTVRLSIDGMSCGTCAASIKSALEKLDGVRKTDIEFEKKGGTVEYDPAKVNETTIVEAVNKTGFTARLAESR